MSIISERIENELISVVVGSSNIKSAVYNTTTETLTVEFVSGAIYEYHKVPWNIFTKFRMSDSQGKYFNTSIAKNYKYVKTNGK